MVTLRMPQISAADSTCSRPARGGGSLDGAGLVKDSIVVAGSVAFPAGVPLRYLRPGGVLVTP